MDILEKLEQLIVEISDNNKLKVEKNNIEEIKESKDYMSNMIFEQATKAIASAAARILSCGIFISQTFLKVFIFIKNITD